LKLCVLRPDQPCIDCGECDDRCELDPQKICDNCFKCLDTGKPYVDIPVSGVFFEDDFSPEPANPAAPNLSGDGFMLDSDDSWREGFSFHLSTLPGAQASRAKRRRIHR